MRIMHFHIPLITPECDDNYFLSARTDALLTVRSSAVAGEEAMHHRLDQPVLTNKHNMMMMMMIRTHRGRFFHTWPQTQTATETEPSTAR